MKRLLMCLSLCFTLPCCAFALNLDKIKINFLNSDYSAAILEGEKIIAVSKERTAGLDELYYILALSYLKDGNILRASDIFEIILNELKNSKFQDEARLGLGDTYLLREDYDRAQACYQELLKIHPGTKLKVEAYYRLSRISFKKGDTSAGKEYLEKIKRDYPSSFELKLDKDICELSGPNTEFYYTVQLGSFSNENNAKNLRDRLTQKGYDAYIEVIDTGARKSYRVRAGKLKLRQEAVVLEKRLSAEGYPTKICP